MCKIERFEKEISVADYLEDYVAVEEFLEYCKACPNYGRIWSCPPYDFDVMAYWQKFSRLRVFARKISLSGITEQSEASALLESVKADMRRQLYELEAQIPGAVSLSAGSCSLCRSAGGGDDAGDVAETGGGDNVTCKNTGGCARTSGQSCRYSDRMRYSIESLGGNVGLTCRKLLGIRLEWMEEGKLPSYFVLAAGLLLP